MYINTYIYRQRVGGSKCNEQTYHREARSVDDEPRGVLRLVVEGGDNLHHDRLFYVVYTYAIVILRQGQKTVSIVSPPAE